LDSTTILIFIKGLKVEESKIKIDQDKCIGCFRCIPYCPVNAIKEVSMNKSDIVEDECVDCGVCIRAGVCTTEAIYMPETPWPRSIRAMFSGGALSFGRTFTDFSYITTKATTNAMTFNDIKEGHVGGGSRGTARARG
jgi:ferredoxin